LARGDTWTPVKAALIAAVVNIAFKVALMGPLAQVGLALATAIGAWINFLLVVWFAARAGLIGADDRLKSAAVRIAAAGLALALVRWFARDGVPPLFQPWLHLGDVAALAALAAIGGIVYGGLIAALFGRQWLASRGRRVGKGPPAKD